jgi:hypothetical protein
MLGQPIIVAVGGASDPLVMAVVAECEGRGIALRRVAPGCLGDLRVELRGETFRVDGCPVGGILFRSPPDASFCEGFAAADRVFCDVEVRAIWLAAFHLDSILAINRYDAAAWFEGAGWPVWRPRLLAAGRGVAPFWVGGAQGATGWSWYPYGECQPRPAPGRAARGMLGAALTPDIARRESLVVGGEVVAGRTSPAVAATAAILADAGIRIAGVVTDEHDRVLVVDTQPAFAAIAARHAARLLCRWYDEHLHRR